MKKPKINWLHKDLIDGPYLCLCLTQSEFEAACEHLGNTDRCRFVSSGKGATLHTYTNAEGDLCCIVGMGCRADKTGIQTAALLVHESVHIFQQYCDYIGEHNPSSEFEAYSIQIIAQRLMAEFAHRLN